MAHYAYLDSNNTVTQVIVGKDENEGNTNWEEYYGAVRTSYNTRGGIHYNGETGEPSDDQSKALRKNYAGVGFSYDSDRDAFIPPQPFASWVLNEETCLWDAPVPYPEDGNMYTWNEETGGWDQVVIPES